MRQEKIVSEKIEASYETDKIKVTHIKKAIRSGIDL